MGIVQIVYKKSIEKPRAGVTSRSQAETRHRKKSPLSLDTHWEKSGRLSMFQGLYCGPVRVRLEPPVAARAGLSQS